jgi:DNA replication protein DnaC
MSDQFSPCEDCGTLREVRTLRFLGVEKVITKVCSKCEPEREEKAKARNRQAVLDRVNEWSISYSEAEDWSVENHPDPEARRIAGEYLEALPRPMESLIAMRDWYTASPEDLLLLRGAQRNAMRSVQGIAFIGKPGRGKTGIASAIHREMRARGIPGCQVNVALLFDEMRARYGDSSLGTVEQLLRPLRMTPLLTLDDLDKLHTGRASNDEMLKLYGIVQKRIEDRMPIMITSNTGLRELAAKFEGHGQDGAAVIDRLAKTTPHSVTLKSPVSFRRMESSHLQSVDNS